MLAILMTALLAADDGPEADLDLMQGTWVLVATADSPPGAKVFVPTDGSFKLTRKGNTALARQRKKVGKPFFYSLNPLANPKQIDTIDADGTRLLGIYELKGDTMKVTSSPPGVPRPASFVASNCTIAVYGREKPKP